jgi:phage baseplate assembly protein W
MSERWGSDMRLLGDLEFQSDRSRGEDLKTRVRPETGEVDLLLASGVANLSQALLLRFLTPAGDLAVLGHPDYGSRLYELLGERNTETTRNRAKLFVLLALKAEARVRQVLNVKVTQNRAEPTRMDIAVSLLAQDSDTPLNLVFPFFLEGGTNP